jgi:hypothetical protein
MSGVHINKWGEPTASYRNNWLRLRNNWWKFKTSRKLLFSLEEYVEYTSNLIKPN